MDQPRAVSSAVSGDPQNEPAGAFTPFQHRTFAVVWSAIVIANIGGWMMNAAASWLMTRHSQTPLVISLAQAAGMLPGLIFALPAGTLADLVDRKRLLVALQFAMAVIAAAFGILVYLEQETTISLLTLIFIMSSLGALALPAMQSINPQLVPRQILRQAVTLNSLGINIARAIGPALAGLFLAVGAAAVPFFTNAAGFLLVMTAIIWWKPGREGGGLRTRLSPLRATSLGLRYVFNEHQLIATMVRSAGFFVFAGAAMALLPLVTRQQLGSGSDSFGILLGSVGVGAVMGALTLGQLPKLTPGRQLLAGTFLCLLMTIVLSQVRSVILAAPVMLIFGGGWIMVLALVNTLAQFILPDWVRSRGLAITGMVFSASMAAGALVWGQIATIYGIETSLLAAGFGGLALNALLAAFVRLPGQLPEKIMSADWSEPVLADGLVVGKRPVVVTIHYHFDEERIDQALMALDKIGVVRRKHGARRWQVLQNAAEPGSIVEQFEEAGWSDHLETHAHIAADEQQVRDAIESMQKATVGSDVQHWIVTAEK